LAGKTRDADLARAEFTTLRLLKVATSIMQSAIRIAHAAPPPKPRRALQCEKFIKANAVK
jgi:hypothetical protein